MSGQQGDRRAQRTRRLIADALVALMQEVRFDRITVQAIIDRADVGRSTFYAHFRDKEDVLVGEFTRVLDHLQHNLAANHAGGRQLLPSLAIFRHVGEQQQLYRALVRGHAVDLVYEAGHRHLSKTAERQLAALVGAGRTSAVPLPILADYVAGSLLALLRWWLEHQTPYSPEELDTIFQRLVLPGVQAALESSPAREIRPHHPN